MVIAIVQDEDAHELRENLMKEGHRSTKLSSTGGFLHKGNTTFLMGADDSKVLEILRIIKKSCSAREEDLMPLTNFPMLGESLQYFSEKIPISTGGATIFVVPVERFEQF